MIFSMIFFILIFLTHLQLVKCNSFNCICIYFYTKSTHLQDLSNPILNCTLHSKNYCTYKGFFCDTGIFKWKKGFLRFPLTAKLVGASSASSESSPSLWGCARATDATLRRSLNDCERSAILPFSLKRTYNLW